MTAPYHARGSWSSFLPITSTSVIGTVFIVCAERATRDEEVATPKLVTAGVVMLLGLTFINQIDELFAAAMAFLILVVVFLEYGPNLLTYVGITLGSED